MRPGASVVDGWVVCKIGGTEYRLRLEGNLTNYHEFHRIERGRKAPIVAWIPGELLRTFAAVTVGRHAGQVLIDSLRMGRI